MYKFKINNLFFYNKYPHGYLLKETIQQEANALLFNNQIAVLDFKNQTKIELEKKNLIFKSFKLKDELLQNTYKNYPQINIRTLVNNQLFNKLETLIVPNKYEKGAVILLKKINKGFFARYKGFLGVILISNIYSQFKSKNIKTFKSFKILFDNYNKSILFSGIVNTNIRLRIFSAKLEKFSNINSSKKSLKVARLLPNFAGSLLVQYKTSCTNNALNQKAYGLILKNVNTYDNNKKKI